MALAARDISTAQVIPFWRGVGKMGQEPEGQQKKRNIGVLPESQELYRAISRLNLRSNHKWVIERLYILSHGHAGNHHNHNESPNGARFSLAEWTEEINQEHDVDVSRQYVLKLRQELVDHHIIFYTTDPSGVYGWIEWNLAFDEWTPFRSYGGARKGAGRKKATRDNQEFTPACEQTPDEKSGVNSRVYACPTNQELIQEFTPVCLNGNQELIQEFTDACSDGTPQVAPLRSKKSQEVFLKKSQETDANASGDAASADTPQDGPQPQALFPETTETKRKRARTAQSRDRPPSSKASTPVLSAEAQEALNRYRGKCLGLMREKYPDISTIEGQECTFIKRLFLAKVPFETVKACWQATLPMVDAKYTLSFNDIIQKLPSYQANPDAFTQCVQGIATRNQAAQPRTTNGGRTNGQYPAKRVSSIGQAPKEYRADTDTADEI